MNLSVSQSNRSTPADVPTQILFKVDTFVEVSDEVAAALLELRREENRITSRIRYHKAYFSLDASDGIENHALNWAQPSPEEILIRAEEELFNEITLERLNEALSHLTPTQARRIHSRYMLGMPIREIAGAEGVETSSVYESVKGGLTQIRRYFDKHKWRDFEE